MELKPQTVIKMTVVKKNGYCPVFREGDTIAIHKHCFDVSRNTLQKYCYATLHDVYQTYSDLRKKPVGSKEIFKCRDNGIIEIELERCEDEFYDFKRK